MSTSSKGFTVIELLVIVVLLGAASILFFIQKGNVEVAARDGERKTAINAIYYSLEEVYFKQHASYPSSVSKDNLPSVDPDLFTDPNGLVIGDGASSYRYEPTNCTGDVCKSYSLRTTLENEADFVRESKNK